MKKLFLAIIVWAVFVPMVFGADVVITITIPDAYVSRVQDAVSNIDCNVYDEGGEITDTLNDKECLKRKIITDLKTFVKYCEKKSAIDGFKDTYNSSITSWETNYVDLGAD